jgi:hypothetical protein
MPMEGIYLDMFVCFSPFKMRIFIYITYIYIYRDIFYKITRTNDKFFVISVLVSSTKQKWAVYVPIPKVFTYNILFIDT